MYVKANHTSSTAGTAPEKENFHILGLDVDRTRERKVFKYEGTAHCVFVEFKDLSVENS